MCLFIGEVLTRARRLRFHPVAPYAERVATRDDVLPLRYPFAAADGRTVSEIAIRAGQVRLHTSLPSLPVLIAARDMACAP